jgi:hypothetical protein
MFPKRGANLPFNPDDPIKIVLTVLTHPFRYNGILKGHKDLKVFALFDVALFSYLFSQLFIHPS